MWRRLLRRLPMVGALALCFPLSGCYMVHAYQLVKGNAAYTPITGKPDGRAPQHLRIVEMRCVDKLVDRQTFSRRVEEGITHRTITTTRGTVQMEATEYCDTPSGFEAVGYFHSPFVFGDAAQTLAEIAQHRGCSALALRPGQMVVAGMGKAYIGGVCGDIPGEPKVPANASYRLPTRAQKLGFMWPGVGHLYSGDYVKGGLLAGAAVGSLAVVLSAQGQEDPSPVLGWVVLGTLVGSHWYSYKDSRPAAERANARNGFTSDLRSRPAIADAPQLRLQPYLLSSQGGKPRLGLGLRLEH